MTTVTLDAPPPTQPRADAPPEPDAVVPRRRGVVLHPDDNVGVALAAAEPGEDREGTAITTEVPAGHKFARRAIAEGEPVLKFGYPIGLATADIPAGAFVHSHNVRTGLKENLTYRFDALVGRPLASGPLSPRAESGVQPRSPDGVQTAPGEDDAATAAGGDYSRREQATFDGFRRPDGRAATRNEIWIVNTVGCVNMVAQRIAERATRELLDGSTVEGVYTFPHPFGCSQLGDDLANTQELLAGLINHPNAGGVLVLGLGCENNQLRQQLEAAGPIDPDRVKFFYTQSVDDEIEHGLEIIRGLVAHAGAVPRTPIPAGELILGLKCGGSDGYSGITGNPLLGRLADRHAGRGGTSILTEVPEMFGAEEVLLRRCGEEAVFDELSAMVNRFKDYFRRHDQPVSENPSPGNKAGGITTLEEKSLGCVQKGGQAPVKEVRGYGKPVTAGLGGLSLVNAPGNDGTSCTAMVAAGAHVILFTTGRGTPMGFPAPTLKVSTNSGLARRKTSWIDFDAGRLLDLEDDVASPLDALCDDLDSLVLATASGQPTRNETNGYREIAIWKTGVTV